MRDIVKSVTLLATVVVLLSTFGCGGGGGGGGTVAATFQNQGPGYTLQVGESGISSPQFLSYSTLSSSTVGWGKQLGAFGTIAFGTRPALTGTFTSSSPATNAAMTWTVVDRAITLTIASSPGLVYSYSQLAVNASANYYVMIKSQKNADGSTVFVDYERWYIGTGAAAAAQLFAKTVTAFTADLVAGKKLQNISISSPLWTGSTGGAPSGVALDASGGIYVVNTGSNTVQKFTTSSTNPVWTGTTDTNPLAVAVDANGGIYVVNSNPNISGLITVQKFTTASTLPVGSGTITGTYPNSIAVNANGSSIYVTCAQSNTLVKFPALLPIVPPATVPPATTQTWSVTTGLNPAGVALDASGSIYVTNFASNTVQKFDPAAGALVWTAATSAGPTGVAVDASGGVYVTCTTANVVQKFSTTAGALLWTASTGLKPEAVAVDASGGIFVTSSLSNTVQKFTTAATTPVWTGNTGTLPSGVAVDASGEIFVTNYGSATVQKFTVTGFTTVYSFLANGTFTSTVTPGVSGSGTWVVNSDGSLTLNFINPSSSTTFSVQSGSTTSVLILNAVNSDGSAAYNLTMTYV